MEEKRTNIIKKIKIVAIFIILFFIVLAIIPMVKNLFFCTVNKSLELVRPDKIDLVFISVYSGASKLKITDFVKSFFKNKKIENIDLKEFCFFLKEEFNFIKTIEWNFSAPGFASLKIIGKEPRCLLNEKFICTGKDSVFNIDFFTDYRFSCTKEFLSKNVLSNRIVNFMDKISLNVWDEYKVDYENKNNILLIKKDKKLFDNYEFITDKKNILNEEKLLNAKRIFKYLSENKKINSRKNYVLDLRYDKRILLKNKRNIRGGSYGKKNL